MMSAALMRGSTAVVKVVIVPPCDRPIMPMRFGFTSGRVSR